MKIRKSRATPEDVDCKYCTEYVPKVGCTAFGCIILPERIEAGVVGYREIIADTFGYNRLLMKRLSKLVTAYPGTMWADEPHRQRFCYSTSQCDEQLASPAYYAAVYLITSNTNIYNRAFRCFLKSGLYIPNFRIQGISPDNYTLVRESGLTPDMLAALIQSMKQNPVPAYSEERTDAHVEE